MNARKTIEDEILSKLPGFENEGGQDEATQDDEVIVDAPDAKKQQTTSDNDSVGQDDTTSIGDKQTPATKPVVETKTKDVVVDPKPAEVIPGQAKLDKNGNVVDATGRIVAKAGYEARWFNTAQKARTERDHLAQITKRQDEELRAMRQRIVDMNLLNEQPKKLGLNEQDTFIGLQLISMYKKDPKQFLSYVLTEMTKAGHDVSAITGVKGAVDPQAIQQLIQTELSKHLGPLQQQQQVSEAHIKANKDAEFELNQFFAKHPDAVHHDSLLAEMLNEDPNLSLNEAFLQLQLWCVKNNCDISQPLGPQLDRLKASNGKRPTTQATRPLPNGNARMPINETKDAFDNDFTATSSYDDIVRAAMREAGLVK